MGYVKMTGEEIRMTVMLRIMWATMNGKGGRTLEKRLRSFPRGWMQFRQATGLLDKMFAGLEKTITDRQLVQINNTIRNGEVSVKLTAGNRTYSGRGLSPTSSRPALSPTSAPSTSCRLPPPRCAPSDRAPTISKEAIPWE